MFFTYQEKKEEIWLSPMTNAPTLTEKSKKQRDNIKNATKNFDYTTIADLTRVQYPKCAYGPLCKLNPILNGVYI